MKPFAKNTPSYSGSEAGKETSSRSFFWLFAPAVFILLISSGLYALHDAPGDKDDDHSRSWDLKQIREGWWETSHSIYFDIPARVVFRMAENGENRPEPEAVAKKIWNEFERIGNIFNAFNPDSETACLNKKNKRKPIPVSREMYEVLSVSEKLWEASDGAFDPTMLPVKQMWEKAVESGKIPSNRDILRTKARVGFADVELHEAAREIHVKNKGIQFDFGGIAKGYAVDKVTALLREHDIPDALVVLAGEIRSFGQKDDSPWRIGIQHPIDMQAVWGVLSSETGICVSTSGNYRQPLVIAGHELYHIFDPVTARPVTEKIAGVTTLCRFQDASGALLDGAATAIVVMGKEKGLAFAEDLGIDALVLKQRPNGTIEESMTRGFRALYEPLDP